MNSVIFGDYLTLQHLQALIDGDVAALQIKSFIDRTLALRLATWFIKHPSRQNYQYSDATGNLANSDTDRIGSPLSLVYASLMHDQQPRAPTPASLELDRSFEILRNEIRKVCLPYAAPIDNFRVLLDELWPNGASIAKFGTHRPYAGVVRVLRASGPNNSLLPEPHMDWLPPAIANFDFQFSAIIYLDVPDSGGELDIWKVNQTKLRALTYGDIRMLRSTLGPEKTLQPKTGDLIIINTRLPHAVRPPASGERIVQSCFFGGAYDEHLSIWS